MSTKRYEIHQKSKFPRYVSTMANGDVIRSNSKDDFRNQIREYQIKNVLESVKTEDALSDDEIHAEFLKFLESKKKD